MKLILFSGLLFLGAFQHFSAGAPTEDLVASALNAEVPSESGIEKRDTTAVQAAVDHEDGQGESLVDAGDAALREERGLKYSRPNPTYSNEGSNYRKPAVVKKKKYSPVVQKYPNNRLKKVDYKKKVVFGKVRKYKTSCCKKRYDVSNGRGRSSKGSKQKGSYRHRKVSKKHRKSSRGSSKSRRSKYSKKSKKGSKYSKKSKKGSKYRKKKKKSRGKKSSSKSKSSRKYSRPYYAEHHPGPAYTESVEYTNLEVQPSYYDPPVPSYNYDHPEVNHETYLAPGYDYNGQISSGDYSGAGESVQGGYGGYTDPNHGDPYSSYNNADPRNVGEIVAGADATTTTESPTTTPTTTPPPPPSTTMGESPSIELNPFAPLQ